MKKNLYLLTLSVLVFTACHKTDKPAPPPAPPTGTATGTAVGKQLSATDSLSGFNNYFKATALTDDDVATGITLFAPLEHVTWRTRRTGERWLPRFLRAKRLHRKGPGKGLPTLATTRP